MRTSIPDFSQQAGVYTQLAKYLAQDKNCTVQDVINAYNSIKDTLKSVGKPAKDEDIMQVLNQFRSMVRDSDINFLYQKANLNKDQIIDFIRGIATNAFGTRTWKSGVLTYLNNIIQNNNSVQNPKLEHNHNSLTY